MNKIINYFQFKEELEKYKKNYNSINLNNKMSVCLSKYDSIYKQFKKIKSMQQGKFTTIDKTEEQLEEEIINKLKQLYSNKMNMALSQEDYKSSEAFIRGYLSNFSEYKSQYFNGIIQTFIKDMEIVLENIEIIYRNYNNENKIIINKDGGLYNSVVDYVVKFEKVSATLLQRVFKLSYNEAAKLVDQLEDNGVISHPNGSKPREVLLTSDKLYKQKYNTNKFINYFSQLYGNEISNHKTIKNKIEIIDNDINGYDFEKITKDLLESNGFNNVTITQFSGDFGVDVIAEKDNIKYAIQCKKYSSKVGIKAVQEVIASKSMNNCHVAVVLTNNYFTNSAKTLANKNNVLLWDRNYLIKLLDKYK